MSPMSKNFVPLSSSLSHCMNGELRANSRERRATSKLDFAFLLSYTEQTQNRKRHWLFKWVVEIFNLLFTFYVVVMINKEVSLAFAFAVRSA